MVFSSPQGEGMIARHPEGGGNDERLLREANMNLDTALDPMAFLTELLGETADRDFVREYARWWTPSTCLPSVR